MNKVFKYLSIFILLVFTLPTFATEEDNSIIEELNENEVKELNFDFKLKTFESCQSLESVMGKYIKEYYKTYGSWLRYWWPEIMYDDVIDIDMEEESAMDWAVESGTPTSVEQKTVVANDAWWEDSDYSQTNTQVKWVDESDIIKTDGDYIYYYNSAKKAIFIIDAKESANMKIVRKLNLPDTFSSPVLYLSENRLIILASGYSSTNYEKMWYRINRNNKTYTIIFDTTNKEKPVLSKLYVNDGNLRKSRKIGKYVYVLSNNYFNIPYYTFESEDDIEVISENIIPKKLELSKTNDTSEQNLVLNGKKFPYRFSAWWVAKCNEIEYVLPDEETLKQFRFNPSYNIISIIDTEDFWKEVKTKVIAWSNSEVYMSLDNLYLTDNIYQSYNYECPENARCIMPYYYGGTNNTLVHKLGVQWENITYKDSTIIPWMPLNQYSMDQKDTDFRIITTQNIPERSTWLYILDGNLNLKSSLTWLWKWENFQSSRFIWDKLFLVTFRQIDPLFAIDLSNSEKPEVLWELKIPWYSTYLHPYDENHLIWLWYDTTITEWGWTRNGWVKVDLYEVNYDKKCWDADLTAEEKAKCDSWDYKWIIVKQLQTLTLWDAWSYSEALNNPRMFIWNKAKNMLLLPVTLYKNESETSYKHIDFFNWLSAIKITPSSIVEEARITHIDTTGLEEARQKDCEKYLWKNDETQECKELLDWTMYCPPVRETYVPEYCYKDSPIWSYIAQRAYQFRDSFIKRALYIWEGIFWISDKKVTVNKFSDFSEAGSLNFEQ